MNVPSDKALALAEELIDYVHPGMSRASVRRELAGMVDDCNADLLAAVEHLLAEAGRHGAGPCAEAVAGLQEVAREYQPLRDAVSLHEDLFGERRPVQTQLFPGAMP